MNSVITGRGLTYDLFCVYIIHLLWFGVRIFFELIATMKSWVKDVRYSLYLRYIRVSRKYLREQRIMAKLNHPCTQFRRDRLYGRPALTVNTTWRLYKSWQNWNERKGPCHLCRKHKMQKKIHTLKMENFSSTQYGAGVMQRTDFTKGKKLFKSDERVTVIYDKQVDVCTKSY